MRSNFIQKCQRYLNDNVILEKKENPESLYFKNSTELHQNDKILKDKKVIKQGFLKRLKNLNNFKGNKTAIIEGLKEFCSKYHFVVPKRNGKTLTGTYGKRIGDYIVLIKCDMDVLDKMKTGIFKQSTLKAKVTVTENDGETAVQGLSDKQIEIKPSDTVEEIAGKINKVIGARLHIEVTTDPPSKGSSDNNKKENKEKSENSDKKKNKNQTDKSEKQSQTSSEQEIAPTNKQGVPINGYQPQTFYPVGAQGSMSYIGGIPFEVMMDPKQFGQTIILNIKQNPNLDNDQKKQAIKDIKQSGTINKLSSAMKKLKQNPKVYNTWMKVLGSPKQLSELKIK